MKHLLLTAARLTAVLCVCLALFLALPAAMAASTRVLTEGKCGDDVYWSLNARGEMKITGSGYMDHIPWTAYRSRIETVTVEEDVVSIFDYAFNNCKNLTEVKVPDSLIKIGEHAFEGCDNLAVISLPDEMEILGIHAFAWCPNLNSMRIPGTVITIQAGAFLGCSGMKSVTIGSGTETISASAFEDCAGLESVTIPSSVTGIGEKAFSGCAALKNVVIPRGVKKIRARAFLGCASLTELVIPDKVETIENSSFEGCAALSALTLPLSVKTIGSGAFVSCTGLRDIFYIGTQDDWNNVRTTKRLDRADPLFSAALHFGGDRGGECGTNVTYMFYDDGLLQIRGSGAMADYRDDAAAPWSPYKEEIRVLRLENGVTGVGTNAMALCENLVSVHVSPTCVRFGDGSFRGCTALTGVKLPEGFVRVGARAFADCVRLYDITLPDSVLGVAAGAFSGCTALRGSFTLPDGLAGLGDGAFQGCTGLNALQVGEDCELLQSIDGMLYNKEGTTLLLCPAGKSGVLQVPEGTVTVSAGVFKNCQKLTEIVLPPETEEIGAEAFADCPALLSIRAAEENSAFDSVDGVLYNRERSKLLACPGGKSGLFVLPDGLEAVGTNAFSGCRQLTAVTIPASLRTIGSAAFAGCTALERFDADPENPAFVSEDGLLFNKARTELLLCPGGFQGTFTVPETVSAIGEHAFDGCSGLTGLSIPLNVIRLGDGVFARCSGLTSVLFRTENGKSPLSVLPASIFEGCDRLSTVIVPEGVAYVGKNAFDGCYSLTALSLPASLACVDNDAFARCPRLQSVFCSGGTERWSAVTVNPGSSRLSAAEKLAAGDSIAISFAAGGGAGEMEPWETAAGEMAAPPAPAFTPPEGTRFRGWLVNGTTVAAGEEIYFRMPLTLTAVWEPVPND